VLALGDDSVEIDWSPEDALAIERVRFASGEEWDQAALEARAVETPASPEQAPAADSEPGATADAVPADASQAPGESNAPGDAQSDATEGAPGEGAPGEAQQDAAAEPSPDTPPPAENAAAPDIDTPDDPAPVSVAPEEPDAPAEPDAPTEPSASPVAQEEAAPDSTPDASAEPGAPPVAEAQAAPDTTPDTAPDTPVEPDASTVAEAQAEPDTTPDTPVEPDASTVAEAQAAPDTTPDTPVEPDASTVAEAQGTPDSAADAPVEPDASPIAADQAAPDATPDAPLESSASPLANAQADPDESDTPDSQSAQESVADQIAQDQTDARAEPDIESSDESGVADLNASGTGSPAIGSESAIVAEQSADGAPDVRMAEARGEIEVAAGQEAATDDSTGVATAGPPERDPGEQAVELVPDQEPASLVAADQERSAPVENAGAAPDDPADAARADSAIIDTQISVDDPSTSSSSDSGEVSAALGSDESGAQQRASDGEIAEDTESLPTPVQLYAGAGSTRAGGNAPSAQNSGVDQYSAQLAQTQQAIQREIDGFFARITPAPLSTQDWLYNWLSAGSRQDRMGSISRQETRDPSVTAAPTGNVHDAALMPGGEPASGDISSESETDTARGYAEAHAWLDAHPGFERGALDGALWESRAFGSRASALAGSALSLTSPGGAPGIADLGAGAFRPLAGLREGFAPLSPG
jgi:hypothetical protein